MAFCRSGEIAVARAEQSPTKETTQAEGKRPSFAEWLAAIRAEAQARGIRADVVDEALSGIDEPLPDVIERDRTQTEIVLPLEKYIARRLSPRFVATGRAMFTENRAQLDRIAAQYEVPAAVIVAVWGLESNYGRFSGVRPTVAALATLAWDPRRSALFRGELFDALEILNRGDIGVHEMRGSWAGAMGQVQFMPSSYLQFAVDFDEDGRRDIWSTRADVFASIANYLKGHGWAAKESWGREVSLSDEAERHVAGDVERRTGSCQATRDMTVVLPAARWRELGVRTMAGRPLPTTTPDAALVSGRSRHFLVYRNYDALLQYNCAHSYAISVGLLGDRIGAAPQPAPRPESRRTRHVARH